MTQSNKYYFFDFGGNSFCTGTGTGLIFLNGKWAELVKEDSLTIGSYDVTFNGNSSINIGCKKLDKQEIQNLRDLMLGRFSEVTFEGIKVNIKTIDLILSKLK